MRPANAIDLLWQRLDASHDEVSFAKVGPEIRATWGEDLPISMDRDVGVEVGRRAVLGILSGVCERAPELELDWFAVGPR
jgi:hypothetical protein